MAPYKSYIPQADAQFDEWFRNFSTNISAIATPLGVTPALITAVTAAFADWQLAYAAHQTAHNAAQAAAEVKDESRALSKEAVRIVVGMIQKNPALTDADRQTLAITVPDLTRTPTSPEYVVNLAPPILLLDWSGRGQVVVHFGVNPSNEKRNAKPIEIAGAKIWFRVESGPWTFVADDTNSPYTHNLAITEPANVEYRAQWFDNKSRTGPFSETAKCTVSP
ncbi:MAG: hypothetical protein WC980_00230 [Candidatus Brocadiia bacterium]